MAMEIHASLTVTILSIRGPPVARAFTPTVGTVRPGHCQFYMSAWVYIVSAWVYIVLPSARLAWVGTCTARPTSSAVLKLGHA